jgi:hypothetical protein
MKPSLLLTLAVLFPVATAVADSGSGPIVLELFTSQGCSSCPPADQLLSRLAEEDDVVALSFHVDYWNYIGWTDPFSSEEWSKRQRLYGKAFRSGRIYTPQLVVDGRSHCVGSDRDEVRRQLAEARRQQHGGKVELQVGESTKDGVTQWAVVVTAAAEDALTGSLDLWVAVVETGLVTPVGRGENAKKTLKNDFVVRRLTKTSSVTPGAATPQESRLSVVIDSAWRLENVGIAAFLQDSESLRIHGAALWRRGR